MSTCGKRLPGFLAAGCALTVTAQAEAASQASFEIRGYVPVTCSLRSENLAAASAATCNSQDQVFTSVSEQVAIFTIETVEPAARADGWRRSTGFTSGSTDPLPDSRFETVRVITISL